eukprot:TRINITY_DN2973_c0_g1_i2.p1 TRINITY_DN2973_c0_g1~~TRINITY_DN2973_c0_g1_i2.p1  ORF type:complete len:779 (+),score=215.97 TRINITY_DN2973_c0_g1_i2:313-2337(+)
MEVPGLALSLLSIVLFDFQRLARGDRMWSVSVVLIDVALVLNLDAKHTQCLVGGMLCYLVFSSLDRVVIGLSRESGVTPWICDCDAPPCDQPVTVASTEAFFVFFIFLTDFYLTRGFAAGMRHQMSMIEQAIEVTAEIAQQLSRYEVDEGRALLDGRHGELLPPVLKTVLHALLDNLDRYKPYLPDSVLFRDRGWAVSAAEPPGLGQEDAKVTMCFTDIQSSTELWEGYPQAMYSALIKHNEVVRETAAACGGYEVKVIGDSFMLAFESAESGCRFGLDVQVALADAKWPSDLLQHPLCRPVAGAGGEAVWGGPRVRIGINYGEARVERNPVTGRCDYFGSTVNTAARVEACLRHGGLTAVTAAVIDELGDAGLSRLGLPVLVPLGGRELKGVRGLVSVTVILRQRLRERGSLATAPGRTSVCGSDRSSSLSSRSSFAARSARVRLGRMSSTGMQRRTVTAACFRTSASQELVPLFMQVGAMLEAVEYAADSTQGLVVGTLSMQCTVVWNGPRVCLDHYDQCLRALDCVRAAQLAGVVSGACSGEIAFGTVSAGRKKHLTVVGGCVELSASLAEAAEQGEQVSLAASTFGKFCATQRRTVRYADWKVRDWDSDVVVWAVSPPPEQDTCQADSLGGSWSIRRSADGGPEEAEPPAADPRAPPWHRRGTDPPAAQL